MKKILSIILALAMILSFAACSDNVKDDTATTKPYIVNNNLEIEEIDYSQNEDGFVEKQYFKINGLKNEKIQDQINKEIEDTFLYLDSWTEIPAYRGIQLNLKKFEGRDPESTWANANVCMNESNILSVYLDASKQYSKENAYGYSDYLTVSNSKTLNYDLNTGNLLSITDVFKDGVDGIAYINEKINDMLLNSNSDEEGWSYSDGWNTFKLVGLFDGIKEDQKFYLQNYGNSLVLILDYDTPWAMTDSAPMIFTVDISEVSALNSKYVKENIYTDETKNYIFPYSVKEEELVVDRDIADYRYLGIDNCFYDNNVVHYKASTKNQVKPVLEFVSECEEAVQEFVDTIVMPHRYDDGLYCGITINCVPQKVGNYTIYRCNCYMDANVYSNNDYISLGNKHLYKVINYKDGVDEALKLEDLFVPGYDLTQLGENIDDFSFQIGNEAIFFENDYDYITWDYKDLGCDNLTLFD